MQTDIFDAVGLIADDGDKILCSASDFELYELEGDIVLWDDGYISTCPRAIGRSRVFWHDKRIRDATLTHATVPVIGYSCKYFSAWYC